MDKNLIPVYKRVGPVFVKGKGSFLWDKSGVKYLDLFPGWGVGILGHSHKVIVKAIKDQSADLIFLPNNLNHKWQSLLADEIIKSSFPGKVFFGNSGAEGVEAAIKLSRLYGKGKRHEIITASDSFHGRTFAAVSATGQKKYKDPFKPILPGFKEVKFNDIEAIKLKLNKKTVAVMIELVQGEGGINIADKKYVKDIATLCKKKNILFIVDEVQTGMGRTAKMFCYQHYGIKPDIMILSKGLGAGVPISCIVAKKSIADLMQPGHHASTFGGNPLVSKVTLEVFKTIKKEKLLKNAKLQGDYLRKRLLEFKKDFSVIKNVRGLGLMVGVELSKDAAPFFKEALKNKLIINYTQEAVLRIMPALNVKKSELDMGLNILKKVFKKLS